MDVIITVRCTEDIKKVAKLAAKQESRTLSNYIICLLKADLKKKGIELEK